MFTKFLGAALSALSIVLAGCATSPVASDTLDQAAKTFAVRPDKANIYVYRNEAIGGAVSMDVYLDGQLMGKSGAQAYFVFEVSPGKHSLLSKAENESKLDVVVEPGKNYFVWQEVKMGFMFARNLLQIVDETTGRAGVAECKLLARAP